MTRLTPGSRYSTLTRGNCYNVVRSHILDNVAERRSARSGFTESGQTDSSPSVVAPLLDIEYYSEITASLNGVWNSIRRYGCQEEFCLRHDESDPVFV